MSPIMQQFREIETCIECSALNHIQVHLRTALLYGDDWICISLFFYFHQLLHCWFCSRNTKKLTVYTIISNVTIFLIKADLDCTSTYIKTNSSTQVHISCHVNVYDVFTSHHLFVVYFLKQLYGVLTVNYWIVTDPWGFLLFSKSSAPPHSSIIWSRSTNSKTTMH